MAAPTTSGGGLISPTFAQTTAEFRLSSDISDSDAIYEDAGEEETLGLKGRDRGRRGKSRGDDDNEWSPAGDEDTEDEYDEEDEPRTRGIRLHPRSASVSTTASFQLYTYEEEEEVVRKFDRKLVVFVALLYMLSFVDRSSKCWLLLPSMSRGVLCPALPSSD